MLQIHLRKLNDEQRDIWLKTVLPLVIGKDRQEARRILSKAAHDKYTEMKERAEEKGVNVSVVHKASRDLDSINQLILYTYFPYTPEYEPGVVPPKGGPYDLTLEERFYRDEIQGEITDGQLTRRAFKGNRKHVTVSVEGFDKPVKLKTQVIESDYRSWLPTVFGRVIIDDVEYVFAPGENKQIYYSDEGKIDEGKPWRMVGEPRPLEEWQLKRRARTAKRRATQLTKAEKTFLDDYLFNMIKDWEEAREAAYQRSREAAGQWGAYDIKRGAAITIPIMGDQISPYRFEWPGEPSEKAKNAFSYSTRHGEDRFSESMIRNSLNRLLRKELITKYSEERGKPAEYWIREQPDG